LRAIVWAINKNADRSTRFAARVGQFVAFLFILDGIWQFFSGAGFGGLWIERAPFPWDGYPRSARAGICKRAGSVSIDTFAA
jgi:hypothetical protein